VDLEDSDTATPTFTAPIVDEETEFVFQLTVSNDELTSEPDNVSITIKPLSQGSPVLKPVANAGSDMTVQSGETVELDGSQSYDPTPSTNNIRSLEYDWTLQQGPEEVDLEDSDTATPTFTAPIVDEETEFVFQLTVSNDELTSEPDNVYVIITSDLSSEKSEFESDVPYPDSPSDLHDIELDYSTFQSSVPECDLNYVHDTSEKGRLTLIIELPFTQIYKITPSPYTFDESLYFVNNDFFDCDADESTIVLDNLDYSWYNIEVIDQTNINNSKTFDISINSNLSSPLIRLLNNSFIPNLVYEPIPFQYIIWLDESVTTDALKVAQDYSPNGIIKFVYNDPAGFVININKTGSDAEMRFLTEVHNDPRILGINQDLNGKIASLKYNNQTIPDSLKRVNANIINITNKIEQGEPINGSNVLNFSNVDIAILDTGISLGHPDLNVYRNVSFIDGALTGDDDLGHGSHIAGIAAAKDNSMGIIGAAPGAKLWAIKVCDSSGNCPLSAQIQGIQYINEHSDEIDVVNLSIENPTSDKLDDAIRESISKGLIYVTAAGNSQINSTLTSPARIPEVITVSAISDSDGECGGRGNNTFVGPDDFIASFSNFGNTVDFAAPGVNVLSTYLDDEYAIDSGTSMAAPLVAGQAALYKSFFPNATYNETYLELLNSSIPYFTECQGVSFGHFNDPQNLHQEPLVYSLNITSTRVT
ncbi:MAG: S8 family serine peptidase, partial [Candidatus Nitrosocosmicus sp.]